MEDMQQFIHRYIASISQELIKASDQIWEYAEMGFREYRSAELLCSILKKHGFSVEMGVAGLPTAFIASYGQGSPVIGVLGEYDALSGLSQEAGLPVHEEVVPGGNGHGCGHNVLGAGSLAAVLAVKEYLQHSGVPGTIRYYGCPGEEYGCGKVFMVRAGCFNDLDAALTWHPSDLISVWSMTNLAVRSVFFDFFGLSSHASGVPELGRSALDSVELMSVGANYLREHIWSHSRIHYAYVNAGGISPNVVQDRACVNYYIRSHTLDEVDQIYQRLLKIAEGAALMSGTKVEARIQSGISQYAPNPVLNSLLMECLQQVGPPDFTAEDYNLAKTFRSTISPQALDSGRHKMNIYFTEDIFAQMSNHDLFDQIFSCYNSSSVMKGSTDVGDVSQIVPTSQIGMASVANGTIPHSWQYTAQTRTSIAHRGMLTAGQVLALASLRLIEDAKLMVDVKESFAKTHRPYRSPIPAEVLPGRYEE